MNSLAGFLVALSLGLAPVLSSHAATSSKPAASKAAKSKEAQKRKAAAKPARSAKAAQAAKASKSGKPATQVRAGKPPRGAKASARGARTKATKAVAGNGLRASKRRAAARLAPPPRPSFGQIYGLHATDDELDLKSSVALVVDQDTNEVLFSKNPSAVLPIASITKLMTALVVTEAGLPLHESLAVVRDDVDATAGSRSRLQMGTELSRGEMLHLSLMASENRAAHVLGRTYPGGMPAFVAAMNRKARELGMVDTRYVEPTGLSSDNQSSARDLTQLVRAAMAHPIIRELSTSLEASVPVGSKQVQFRNTNGLVRNPEWDIGLQKTGYIAAAGRCVVMQAELAGRKLIMVLLDSAGRYSRIGDAERLRKWIADAQIVSTFEQAAPQVVPASAGFPGGAAAVQAR